MRIRSAIGDLQCQSAIAIRQSAVEGCTFDTGDDCIALKSGRNEDGRRLNAPIENVIVRGCTMKDGHGGVVIGSEISGGARNIFAERCRMDSPQLDRALRIKTNSVRGGRVEGVYMREVTVGQVAEAVVLRGYPHDPITNVRIADCQFAGVAKDDVIEGVCGLEWQAGHA